MTEEALPAIPDDHGEPRPPRAPRVNGPWPIRASDRHSAVRHHPDGEQLRMGGAIFAVLERVVIRRVNRWSHAVQPVLGLWGGPAVLFSVYAVVVGPTTTVFLILGGILAVVAPVTYLRAALGPESYLVMVAGHRHLGEMYYNSGYDGQVVDLYGLRSISLRRVRRRGWVLRLAEPGKGPLAVPLGALEANQQLWDLVYNGLRHSAAAGAEVDDRTRELLGLPSPRA